MRILLIGRGSWGSKIQRALADFDVDTRVSTYDWVDHLHWTDRVIIATPAVTHFHIAAACIDARKPFLVEKPMTTSPGAADQLVYHSEMGNVPGHVGHIQLHNPNFKRLLEDFHGKQIGFAGIWDGNSGPERKDVSSLWDYLPHAFSMLLAFGDIKVEAAHGTPGFYMLDGRFGNGAQFHIDGGNRLQTKRRSLSVLDQNGRPYRFDGLAESEPSPLHEELKHFLAPTIHSEIPFGARVVKLVAEAERLLKGAVDVNGNSDHSSDRRSAE